MNTRCQYCGKEIADGEDFCSESCASAYRTATGTKLSDLKWLLIGIAVSLFVILWGPITRNEQMVGVGVAQVGVGGGCAKPPKQKRPIFPTSRTIEVKRT